jgi:hypothetical protein
VGGSRPKKSPRNISCTGKKFHVAVKSFLAITVLFNEKYRPMTEGAKHYFKKFQNGKRKF